MKKYSIIKHSFGTKPAYEIFVKENKKDRWESLTKKLFTSKKEAIKYYKQYMRTH